jgi:NRPS condensation-like uncharacterized protein
MQQPAPGRIRLNEIQRTMLQWNSLHPYNVVDFVEVLPALSRETLDEAAKRVFGEMDFGIPRPDTDIMHVDFGGPPGSPRTELVAVGAQTKGELEKFLAREMNAPFDVGRDPAVRLALLEDGSRRIVAMTYQHWVMDGKAAARLFHRILAHALALPREPGGVEELDTPAIEKVLAPFLGGKELRMRLREGLGGLIDRTRAFAPPRENAAGSPVSVRVLAVPPAALGGLRSIARHNGCTVNDVLLAIVFRAIDGVFPQRIRNPWQRNIAICNIADLRKLSAELRNKLGVYVAFFSTRMDRLPGEFPALLAAIKKQTGRGKSERVYLTSLSAFRAVPRLWKLLKPRSLSVLLRTFFRYTAGLSNLRLGEERGADALSGLLHGYTRVCPTGMMLPLIFGVTTSGGELTMTMTWMCDGYSEKEVACMAQAIEQSLASANSAC